MDDRTLISLARLAHEARVLERDLLADSAVHERGAGRRAPARRLLSNAALAVGALACLAMIGVIAGWPIGSPSRQPLAHTAPPIALQGRPAARTMITAREGAAPERASMVIALYRTDGGKDRPCRDCWGLARWTPQWPHGCDVTTVGRDEMLSAMHRSGVAASGAVVLVGLSGPAAELPASDAQAREAALCLMESPAQDCVASAVDVRVHSWPR